VPFNFSKPIFLAIKYGLDNIYKTVPRLAEVM